jgi:Na+/H+-dicarboxylate symporter
MGIDQFLDMGRTATNVIGNSIATSVVAKWEDQLGETLQDDEAIEQGSSSARPTDTRPAP